MKPGKITFILAVIVLLWGIQLKVRTAPAAHSKSQAVAKATSGKTATADTMDVSDAWRHTARPTPLLSGSTTPFRQAPAAQNIPVMLRTSPAKAPVAPRVTTERANKLFELVGVEMWPTINPAEGANYGREDVLALFPSLQAADGSVDEAQIDKVRQALANMAEARRLEAELTATDPFATPEFVKQAREALYDLLRPTLGWTPERRGNHASPSEELLAITPQMERLQGRGLAQFVTMMAVVQTASERRPDAPRYVGDIQNVMKRAHRISLTEEQAGALLNTPIERFVQTRVPLGG